MAGPIIRAERPSRTLLHRAAGPLTDPDALRSVRAVEVLEGIGESEAVELLAEWAKGAPEARLTREAKLALERLARR